MPSASSPVTQGWASTPATLEQGGQERIAGAEVVDPRRGVDQDHGGAERRRGIAMPPPQPERR